MQPGILQSKFHYHEAELKQLVKRFSKWQENFNDETVAAWLNTPCINSELHQLQWEFVDPTWKVLDFKKYFPTKDFLS